MDAFPRTGVGGQSLSRMIVGANWFLGFSHTSAAKGHFIKTFMNRERMADILTVFLERGVDAIMGMPVPMLSQAIEDAQDRVGRPMHTILTPAVSVLPGGPPGPLSVREPAAPLWRGNGKLRFLDCGRRGRTASARNDP